MMPCAGAARERHVALADADAAAPAVTAGIAPGAHAGTKSTVACNGNERHDFKPAYVLRHEEPKNRPHNWDLRDQRPRSFARFRLVSLATSLRPLRAMARHVSLALLTIPPMSGFGRP